MKDFIYQTMNVSNATNIVRHVHHSVIVLHASLKINNQTNFNDVKDVIKDFMNRMRNVYPNVVMASKRMTNNAMMEILVHQTVAVISAK